MTTLQRNTLKTYHYNKVKPPKVSFPHQILTVHVLFMLVLDEGVAPRLRVLRRHHHPDALHGAILLKLALQLALAGDRGFANVSNQWSGLSVYIPGVEVDPGHKESLEGIAGGF